MRPRRSDQRETVALARLQCEAAPPLLACGRKQLEVGQTLIQEHRFEARHASPVEAMFEDVAPGGLFEIFQGLKCRDVSRLEARQILEDTLLVRIRLVRVDA